MSKKYATTREIVSEFYPGITTKDAYYKTEYIRKLCRLKHPSVKGAKKIGRDWLINTSSLFYERLKSQNMPVDMVV